MRGLGFDDNLEVRSHLNEFKVPKERSYAYELHPERIGMIFERPMYLRNLITSGTSTVWKIG